jgi:hypothetical protein
VSAAAVPEDVAGAARRVHRALGTGAQSGAVGDIRRVVDWAVGLIDAVASGTVRVEWGHRLARPEDRARYTDGDEVNRCHKNDRSPDPGVPCDQGYTYRGDPLEHVWRLVTTTKWQTGPAPEVNR